MEKKQIERVENSLNILDEQMSYRNRGITLSHRVESSLNILDEQMGIDFYDDVHVIRSAIEDMEHEINSLYVKLKKEEAKNAYLLNRFPELLSAGTEYQRKFYPFYEK